MTCPECGAPLDPERSCRDYFHDLLALEWQIPGAPGGESHLLAVGTYNLQHPSCFLPIVLVELCQTLEDVLAERASVGDALERARRADGSTRVRRHADTALSADDRRLLAVWPQRWPATVRDVSGSAADEYADRVRAWATSTVHVLSPILNGARHAVHDR